MKIKKIILVSRPKDDPREENFKIIEDDIPSISSENQVLVKTLYLSVDPYMRPKMNDEKYSYTESFKLNEVLTGAGVGRVIQSTASNYNEGDLIYTFDYPWQEIALFNKDSPSSPLRKLNIEHPSYALSVLGMVGLTAYFGFTDICKPKKGETVVVDAAAGAVGSIVGQIGKILGCRVIGIAGSQNKLDIIKGLGFDDGIDYKQAGNSLENLVKEKCPDKVDCFFDNVGGPVSDAVIKNLNVGARIALCGAISQYTGRYEQGPRFNWFFIENNISMKGFIVFREYMDRFEEGMNQLEKWLKEDKIKVQETFRYGLENVPKAFVELFEGKNVGKMVISLESQEGAQ